MKEIVPWLAMFCFGVGVFAVGKYLQSIEQKERLAREASES
jgi:hypothetical protein